MDNVVITLARQYGCGARAIGRLLAEKFGLNYYDRDLIRLAASESGINEKLFIEADEKLKKSLFDHVSKKKYKESWVSPDSEEFTSNDNLYHFQAQVIRKLADQGSCIIVGRCADHVLRDRENIVSIFFHAPFEARLKTVLESSPLSEEEARKEITSMDRYRADYYNYYTGGKNWGAAENYDICLNTARIGIERCTEIVGEYIEQRSAFLNQSRRVQEQE